MPDIRYVCLSDLHFGAGNSLLSHVDDETGQVDPTGPSRTLRAFVDCLEALIAGNEDQSVKPTLILNGDILELALASDEVALMAFEQFVRLAMAERDLFHHQIVYLPGNHDHHVWETSRERAYAEYIARNPKGGLNPPWHATSIFRSSDPAKRERRLATATVQQQILRRFDNLHDATVEVRYPVFGVDADDDGKRAVLFHHGHLAEAIYLLMSELRATAFPASPRADTLALIEAENFAWIDFFWSTMGRSGDWGADVGVIYEMLQDKEALRALADNLAERAAHALPRFVPDSLGRRGLGLGLRKVADKINALERHRPVAPGQVPVASAGVQRLIEGPILRQMAEERPGVEDATFIFGHTHRPFTSQVSYQGLARPAAVYNTGGWVVDTLDPDTLQGASAVLVDEHLDVVSVDLYRQSDSRPIPIRVTTAGQRATPLSARIGALVTPGAGVWAELEQQVADAVPRRYKILERSIARGTEQARRRAPAGA